MKKIIWFLIFVTLSYSCFAFLGVFEPGDFISYSVVCLEDGGKRDTACTGGEGASAFILGPYDSVPINSSLDEVSDTNSPGLWRGNFTVGTNNQTGLWSIFLNLTNSNGTPGATVLHYQIVGDTHGLDAIGTNTVTILSNQAVLKSRQENLNDSLNRSIHQINSSTLLNITNAEAGIISRGDSAWITATGFQTETNALTRYSNLLSNFSDTLNNLTRINLNISAMSDALSPNFQNINFNFSYTLNNLTTLLSNLSAMSDADGVNFVSLSDGIQKNMTALNTNITLWTYNLNLSILSNISLLVFTSTVSAADKITIGKECADQVYRQNLTMFWDYNFTNYALINVTYNYTGLGIRVVERYNYTNESYLNLTERATDNG